MDMYSDTMTLSDTAKAAVAACTATRGLDRDRWRDTRGANGWREIAVYSGNGDLRAIITHPMVGAPWWLHPPGFGRKRRFRSLTAALAAVTE